MPAETPFRIALAVVIALTASVALTFRLRAAQSGEPISRRQEGYLFATILRLAGLGLWISTLAYLIAPAFVAWAQFPIPVPVRWLGVVSGLPCAALTYWTLRSLGPNLTDTVVTRQNATLVTHGPYGWVRHPFYVSAALVMASVTLLTANALIAVSSVLVLTLLAIRTPLEEQMLIERFGPEYRNYMQRTGRFIPRFGKQPDPASSDAPNVTD
ncbi:MAG: isoprenylcysteine carboxylmethyltransferase family protein [Planctomycetaceae bacterium]|nr:isoprenylcysteine carboxylmethyltransferase family protein [Planctomycetaceae bacterium]